MKSFIKFFVIASLFLGAVGVFPIRTEAACGCTCQPLKNAAGLIDNPVYYNVCTDAQSRLVLPVQENAEACQRACASQTVPGATQPQCYEQSPTSDCSTGRTLDCWCKGTGGSNKKIKTPSEEDCKKACASAGQTFSVWSNTPPTSPNQNEISRCPPGGLWKKAECEALTNSDGVKIAKWDAPGGEEDGPYCFGADTPIKLGVNIGGLTQANLAQYMAAAYRLGLGVAAILAVIFIMIGGFQYMAAAGGSGIEQAKEKIKNAVIGLVLTIASFTLLQTVNPDILSLRLPRVHMIKACNLQVDCRSRRTPADCEKNETGSKCVWSTSESICYDNASLETGSAGKLNAECKPDGSCDVGRCVDIGGNMRFCSAGAVCQYCNSDTDPSSDKEGQCAMDNSTGSPKPMKCIDHKCAITEPTVMGKYKACADSTCSSNEDCASGFCGDKGGNGIKRCIEGDQGTTCFNDDGCNTSLKYSCVKATGAGPLVPGKCCLNGNAAQCLGCNNDGQCPFDDEKRPMFCANNKGSGIESIIKAKGLDSTRCIDKFGEGEPCGGSNSACRSGRCENGYCVGNERPTVTCDPASSVVQNWIARIGGDTDYYCAMNTKNDKYYCNDTKYWADNYSENGRPWNVCVLKRLTGEACCADAECLKGSCGGGPLFGVCTKDAGSSSWFGTCRE